MPNCFTLTHKDMLEAGPVNLNTIDEELCVHLGEAVHHDHWCRNWYNSIGLLLSLGKSWNECRKVYEEPEYAHIIPVIDYLEANFVIDAWYQHGR